jgi:DMSO/TMAO reductase YedYZ molybdopterin-dependent catalytic subunit
MIAPGPAARRGTGLAPTNPGYTLPECRNERQGGRPTAGTPRGGHVSDDHHDAITRRQFVMGASASIAALLLTGCWPKPPLVPAGVPTIEQLAKSQILTYKGQKLDSITASRENSIKGVQFIDRKTWKLTVDGLVSTPSTYTFDELLAKFTSEKQVHRLDCVEGWSENQLWEGVRMLDVLNASGVKPDAKVVILHGHDGYTTSYPVDYFKPEHLLVYRLNAVDLPAERGGPLRLGGWSKWGYKWIRWVERIELSADAGYKGYWESRGYSNTGERSQAYFG